MSEVRDSSDHSQLWLRHEGSEADYSTVQVKFPEAGNLSASLDRAPVCSQTRDIHKRRAGISSPQILISPGKI